MIRPIGLFLSLAAQNFFLIRKKGRNQHNFVDYRTVTFLKEILNGRNV